VGLYRLSRGLREYHVEDVDGRQRPSEAENGDVCVAEKKEHNDHHDGNEEAEYLGISIG
jgi:hypothetical protein